MGKKKMFLIVGGILAVGVLITSYFVANTASAGDPPNAHVPQKVIERLV